MPNWRPPPRPGRDTLIGRYCRVEALDPASHASSLHRANALDRDGHMWMYLPYGPFRTLDDYLDWMKSTCLGPDPLFFVIIDVATGDATGLASYMRIEPRYGSIEVGHLAYSPRLQRTRAATEAMYLMMKYAFDLGYRRYEWKCNTLNRASRRAAQRLGLSFEGIFRQAAIIKGRNRDTAWYATIDKEWPELAAAFQQWLDPANFDNKEKQRVRLADLTRPILKKWDEFADAQT